MAATLDPRQTVQVQSQADSGQKGAGQEERSWQPLVVPKEWYVREGLAWHAHQPVSLTVEVNGKRDLMKYAAVMQLVHQLGYVARLGQPGAAAKFQNLHLVDVKRRGSTDIHICLGDLAWVRSRASEASTTAAAAATLASQPTPPAEGSPDASDGGTGATEACVIAGGAAEGGVVSGTSSDGTTAHLGGPGLGSSGVTAEADAGASSNSRSPAAEQDDRATGTSVIRRSSQSCSPGAVGVLASVAAAVAAAAVGCQDGHPDAALASPVATAAARSVAHQCGCVFCPCHYDTEQLMAQTVEKQSYEASPPYTSAVADHQRPKPRKSPTNTTRPPESPPRCKHQVCCPASTGPACGRMRSHAPVERAPSPCGQQQRSPSACEEARGSSTRGDNTAKGDGASEGVDCSHADASQLMCFGKTPPSSGGLPQAPATVPPVASTVGPVSRFALNSAAAAAPTTADVGAGGCNGHISHISRERLRNLCLPALLKSATPAAAAKGAAGLGGSDDAARAAVLPLAASLPQPSRLGGSGCGSAAAALGGTAGGPLGFGAAGLVGAGGLSSVDPAVTAAAVGSGITGGSAAEATEGSAEVLIGWELVLPPRLAAKRMTAKHALVQYEIDGEMEDCKMQYRLVQVEDGRKLALQGISRPLRGLQLLSLSETPEGDLFIRAVTPASQPLLGFSAAAAAAAATVGALVAAPAAVALPSPVAPADLGRPASGRQRRPSLKAREGAEETAAVTATAAGRGAAALAPPYPSLHALASIPAAGPASLSAQDHLLLLQQQQQQQKRRGRPPRARPPPPLLPSTLQLQQHSTAAGEYDDASMEEQAHDTPHDVYGNHAHGFGSNGVGGGGAVPASKRFKTAAAAGAAGRTRSSSMDGGDWGPPGEGPYALDRRERERERDQDDNHPGVIPWRRRSSPSPPMPPSLTSAGRKGCDSGAGGGGSSGGGGCGVTSAPIIGLPPLTSVPQSALLPLPYSATAAAAVRQLKALSQAAAIATAAATEAVSGGEASAAGETAMDADGACGDEAQAGTYRARVSVAATTDSPAALRSSRKRGASAILAAAAEASGGVNEPQASKRSRGLGSLERGSSLLLQWKDAIEAGVAPASQHGSQQQQHPMLKQQRQRWESPQASEAAAVPALAPAAAALLAAANVESHSRSRRAAPRGQPPRRGLPHSEAQPSASEESDGGNGEDEEEDPTASGEAAEAAAGDDEDSGGVAAALDRVASSSLQAGTPQPRAKPRQRANAGKFKSKPIRHPSKITNVVRNAGAILLMIGRNPKVYEKQLRHTFGNNPDTSKALRLLGEQGKVVRSGMGYRMHPYYYTLTPCGVEEYERQLREQGPSYAFALSMGVQLPASDEPTDAPAAAAAAVAVGAVAAAVPKLEPAEDGRQQGGVETLAGGVQEGAAALPATAECGGSREAYNPPRAAAVAARALSAAVAGSPRKNAAAAAAAALAGLAAAPAMVAASEPAPPVGTAAAVPASAPGPAHASSLPAALWLLLAQGQMQQQQQQPCTPAPGVATLGCNGNAAEAVALSAAAAQPSAPQAPLHLGVMGDAAVAGEVAPSLAATEQPTGASNGVGAAPLALPPADMQPLTLPPHSQLHQPHPGPQQAAQQQQQPQALMIQAELPASYEPQTAAPNAHPVAAAAGASYIAPEPAIKWGNDGSVPNCQALTASMAPPTTSHQEELLTVSTALAPAHEACQQVLPRPSTLSCPPEEQLPAGVQAQGHDLLPQQQQQLGIACVQDGSEAAAVAAADVVAQQTQQRQQHQAQAVYMDSLSYQQPYPQQPSQPAAQVTVKAEPEAADASAVVPYQVPLQQAAQEPARSDTDARTATAAAGAALPYNNSNNPYAMYGYVATPYGYLPYALYSAYAAAAAAAAGGNAAPVQAACNYAATTLPTALAPTGHSHHSTAISAAAVPAAYTQAFPAGLSYPAAGAASMQVPASNGAAMAVTSQPQQQATQFPQQHSQVHEMGLSAHMQPQQPMPPQVLPTASMHQQHPHLQPHQAHHAMPQHPHVQLQQQPQPQLQPPPPPAPQPTVVLQQQYRYVSELPCGSWRAEVPGVDGRWYYSPGFATSMQAAAAADLLMSKLRPGEPLNLGINPQEEATLATLSVEQVQAMLWGMASSSSSSA